MCVCLCVEYLSSGGLYDNVALSGHKVLCEHMKDMNGFLPFLFSPLGEHRNINITTKCLLFRITDNCIEIDGKYIQILIKYSAE